MSIAEKINIGNKPIVLVGMMGVGKTTIGRRLAKTLKRDFIDTDIYIEREQGVQIAEIFEKSGEAFFRKIETKAVIALLENKCSVIATGGGAVTNQDVLTAIKENSVSVWLKADPSILSRTLLFDTKRPLIKACNGDVDMLADRLSELSSQRDPLYSQADIIVSAHEKNVVETVKAITNRMSL
tara:strand:+ start:1068 stop:1616 length:549 start_codon:yes stop_codon:yes gene_type:complete